MARRPILVFDSGIGGLTVLREIRRVLPDRRLTYVADDAGFPYGDWDEDRLRTRLIGLIGDLLADYAPEIVVIACNTAATLALADLRAAYPSACFVGTVPAIKPAAEQSRSGLISVLATPATVRRDYTRRLIAAFAAHCDLNLVGSRHLARLAEAHMQGTLYDSNTIRTEIRPCFVEKADRRTDIVVLACTHYPFLTRVFEQLAPWPVTWLDPAPAIARHVLTVANTGGHLVGPESAQAHGATDMAVMTSGQATPALRELLRQFDLSLATSTTN
ncbi:glutamate racemase [Salinisphaera shabanensis T35B1]|uniref:glutamate racemase n=1 Tax=Salinisphaera shabanensis TaxID=180542 RepID=UPI003342D4E9